MSAPRISVCMIAQNEAERIGKALASVKWADEIVVIDGGSDDDTVAVARSHGARVEVNPWPGFEEQYRRSVEACTGDWIFNLDADEIVTDELARQVQEAVRSPDPADGYRVRRRNYFLGRWIRHGGWWPDPQVRLLRRSRVVVEGPPGHESVATRGPVRDLTGALEHDTHPSVAASLMRVDRYSTLLAPDRAARKRIRPWHLFAHPFAAFVRKYVVQAGWLDGVHGFLIASIHANTKFAVYAKAWELQKDERA